MGIGLQFCQTLDCLLFRYDIRVAAFTFRLNLNDVELTGAFDDNKIGEIAVIIVISAFVFKVKIGFLGIR